MLVGLFAFALLLSDVSNHDGDTLRAGGVSYRLAMVDTPEIGKQRPRCWAELAMGMRAAGRVRSILENAQRIEAMPDEDNPGRTSTDEQGWPLDYFGRRLAHISIDGRDLGELLIAEGLGVRWGPREQHDWCRVP